MSIITNDFHLSKTIRGAAKLCSLGFYYPQKEKQLKGKNIGDAKRLNLVTAELKLKVFNRL